MPELLVFTSKSCVPCHKMIENLEKENIPFKALDVNANPEEVKKFHVRCTPTIVHVKDNGEANSLFGFRSVREIRKSFCL